MSVGNGASEIALVGATTLPTLLKDSAPKVIHIPFETGTLHELQRFSDALFQ